MNHSKQINSELMVKLEALTPADQCLVHRVLYYVFADPMMPDSWYDKLERAATEDPETPTDHPIHKPGSDLESSYPQQILQLAYEIQYPQLQ